MARQIQRDSGLVLTEATDSEVQWTYSSAVLGDCAGKFVVGTSTDPLRQWKWTFDKGPRAAFLFDITFGSLEEKIEELEANVKQWEVDFAPDNTPQAHRRRDIDRLFGGHNEGQ